MERAAHMITKLLIFAALACACPASANHNSFVRPLHYDKQQLPEALQRDTVKVLEYERDGNNSKLVRVVMDEHGAESLEYVNVITVRDDFMEVSGTFAEDTEDDDLLYAPRDSLEVENAFKLRRQVNESDIKLMNSCEGINGGTCYVMALNGMPLLQSSFKYLVCPQTPNRIKYRFKAAWPGTYIIRISTQSGSYIIIVRTYKRYQTVKFLWPRGRAHLGGYFKMYFLVVPHSSDSLYNGSFSWSRLDPEDILAHSGSFCEDYSVIFRQRNVALLEQMSRFDPSCFVKIGRCTFDLLEGKREEYPVDHASNSNSSSSSSSSD